MARTRFNYMELSEGEIIQKAKMSSLFMTHRLNVARRGHKKKTNSLYLRMDSRINCNDLIVPAARRLRNCLSTQNRGQSRS